MSEMTAKEYAKQFKRMHKCYELACYGCPFHGRFSIKDECACALTSDTDKAIELVSKWAEEHPERTYLSNLLVKFPETQMRDQGYPKICRSRIYGGNHVHCNSKGCSECWNEVMPEVTE